MVLFSVIIPVYKVEKYLRRCVESVLSQSYQNYEILLIDDGSPDLCPEICDSYAEKDSRIKVIHQENQGVSIARNNGINNASGDWIIFLDSDDWLEKDSLLYYSKEIVEGVDVIQSGFRYNYPDRNVDYLPKTNDFDWNIINLHFCTLCIRKTFLRDNDIYFPKGITFAEDWFFKYKLYCDLKTIKFISYVTYDYFINSESVMNNVSRKNIEDEIKVVNMLDNLNGPYIKALNHIKKVSKDYILFICNDVNLWKKSYTEFNFNYVFSFGAKHMVKSIVYLLGFGKYFVKK